MINVMLPDEIVYRLEEFARQKNRSVADVLATWLDEHTDEEQKPEKGPNWDLILAIGDENVTDMSITVRETLKNAMCRNGE